MHYISSSALDIITTTTTLLVLTVSLFGRHWWM